MTYTPTVRLIRQGAITVNGGSTKPSYEMAGGDVVEMVIPNPEPPEVTARLAPMSNVHQADLDAPEPRFAKPPNYQGMLEKAD